MAKGRKVQGLSMTARNTALPDEVLRMARVAQEQRRAYGPGTPANDHDLPETVADGEPPPSGSSEGVDDDVLFYCAALDHSDTDNAERLRQHFGQDLLVVTQEKAKQPLYAVWTGTHWDVQNGGPKAHAIAQKLGGRIALEVRHIQPTEAQRLTIDDAGDALKKPEGDRSQAEKNLVAAAEKAREAHSKRVKRRLDHAVSSKNAARLSAMLNCLAPHIMKSPDDFNADDYKFAVGNATVFFDRKMVQRPNPAFTSAEDTPNVPPHLAVCEDVKIRVTRGHEREDLITHLAPVDYNPKADCPKWKRFLDYCQREDAVKRLIQVSSGLSLLGITVQKLFFHYGNGANGKSVYMETLCRMLGETSVTLPATSFIGEGSSSGSASPDLARLYGRRMLRVKELPEGEDLKENLVKEVTGGEMVTARDLFAGYMDFKPHFTTLMSGNGYPRISGNDEGIWRRMAVIPWLITIPPDERREFEEMVESFRPEFPGILNWLIEGVRIYLREGLVIPQTVDKATQEYRDDMDRTAGFVTRWIIKDEAAPPLQANALYKAYCTDTEEQGGKPMNNTAFGRAMRKKFQKDDSGRLVYYLGIRIREGLHDKSQTGQPSDYGGRFPPPSDEEWPPDLTP
ncbi:MAG: phage/plasmid primase, family [Bradyrhizobium sp.]|nr:phage/plasmid primase, family [Bradyrhizobium sp.]